MTLCRIPLLPRYTGLSFVSCNELSLLGSMQVQGVGLFLKTCLEFQNNSTTVDPLYAPEVVIIWNLNQKVFLLNNRQSVLLVGNLGQMDFSISFSQYVAAHFTLSSYLLITTKLTHEKGKRRIAKFKNFRGIMMTTKKKSIQKA